MNQTGNDVKRQAIQAAKQKQKEDKTKVLTGVIDNESKTYTFEKTLSMSAGIKKTGTFVAKYLGVAARLRMGTIRAKLLDGAPSQSLDNITDDIAYMVAYLTVSLTKTPDWWSFDEIDDIQDLRAMYLEVYNFTQSFRARNEESTNAGNSTDASSQENVETE